MKIKVLGSSSSGNCYLIDDGGQILILEAGVHIKEIKKGLDFNLSRVVGCIVSHEHCDHSKSISELLSLGVPVGANPKTMEKVKHHRKFNIEANNCFKIGGYELMAFELVHDVETFGYIIKTPTGKRILFATDTQMIMNQFKSVDVYMLECNFDMDSMRKAVRCGQIPPEVLVRVSGTHMSLETVSAYLKHADLSNTKRIMLIHLSDNNSNENKYVDQIQGITGVETIAADVGDVVEILDEPEF